MTDTKHITRIEFLFGADLFGDTDMSRVDERASLARYREMVEEMLEAEYPEADITVRQHSIANEDRLWVEVADDEDDREATELVREQIGRVWETWEWVVALSDVAADEIRKAAQRTAVTFVGEFGEAFDSDESDWEVEAWDVDRKALSEAARAEIDANEDLESVALTVYRRELEEASSGIVRRDRCLECGAEVAESGEPVTVDGWYGGRRFAWNAGQLRVLSARCPVHLAELRAAEREEGYYTKLEAERASVEPASPAHPETLAVVALSDVAADEIRRAAQRAAAAFVGEFGEAFGEYHSPWEIEAFEADRKGLSEVARAEIDANEDLASAALAVYWRELQEASSGILGMSAESSSPETLAVVCVIERTEVTSSNVEEIRTRIPALDQCSKVEVGSVVSVFTSDERGPAERIVITVWHSGDRAGVDFGGGSFWGDWDDAAREITFDDGRPALRLVD